MPEILILEPFYGGSHKQLIDTVTSRLEADRYDLVTLPAKKWHWRARTSALKLSQIIPRDAGYKTLFTSSVVSLSELIGLRPDLSKLNKILYFHENQLCYPVQNVKDRDFQFGYNQITSSLCADQVLFNSDYNMQSFLDNIKKYLSLQPDQRPEPTRIEAEIRKKSQVCYFPLQLDKIQRRALGNIDDNPLHIVWPHRWEHDKDPEMFCRVMMKLHDEGHTFHLSVLGEVFSEIPDVMLKMKKALGGKINCFGYLPEREDYLDLLGAANVVLSTARYNNISMIQKSILFIKCLGMSSMACQCWKPPGLAAIPWSPTISCILRFIPLSVCTTRSSSYTSDWSGSALVQVTRLTRTQTLSLNDLLEVSL